MNFIYPLSRYLKITQKYHSGHLGIDFGWGDGLYCNQPIIAIEDGTVVGCADGYDNTYPDERIYGNYVNISHGGGYWSIYGHLLKGIMVVKGQTVRKGQVLGYMGNSGYSMGQHLHFELRKGTNEKVNSIDPLDYLYIEDRSVYVNPATLEWGRIRYRNDSPVNPVLRDETKDQILVDLDVLNCRNGASTECERLGFLARGYYNVYNTEEYQGYTWYNIERDRWCAGVDGVTFLKGKEGPRFYKIQFPFLSPGDRDRLLDIADELQLRVIVEEL